MHDALLGLPAHLRMRLASALETGLVAAPYTGVAVRAAAGIGDDLDAVVAALEDLERLGVTGRGAHAGRIGRAT